MSKATFPETTGQESLKPETSGSRSSSDIRNALSALFQGDLSPLRPRAQDTPNMTVKVNPAVINSFFSQVWLGANAPLNYTGGNSPTVTAPVSNPRIDLLTINSSGTLEWTQGSEAASPSSPNCPSGKIPICYIYCKTTMAKIVNYEDKDAAPNDGYIYQDVRPFLNLGGKDISGASFITTQAEADLTAEKVLGTDIIMIGLTANKPAASIAGRIYVESDGSRIVWRDTGSAWEEIARGEVGIRLAQLAERAHSSLTGIGANDHHTKFDSTDHAGISHTEGMIANDAISQSKLKTAIGEVSGDGQYVNLTLPGGTYGFYPQLKGSFTGGDEVDAALASEVTLGSYTTNITFNRTSGTCYAQQRYISSSGQDHWLFLLIDKATKDIIGGYSAPDHPAYGNGGDFEKVPHPFPDYDPNYHEIVLVDNDTIAKLKLQATEERSLLTIVNDDLKLNIAQEENYVPLHSGRFIDKQPELVQTIPAYIKVRKLLEMSDQDKQEKLQRAMQKAQEEEQRRLILEERVKQKLGLSDTELAELKEILK